VTHVSESKLFAAHSYNIVSKPNMKCKSLN